MLELWSDSSQKSKIIAGGWRRIGLAADWVGGGLIEDADPGDVVQREGLEATGIHVMPA